MRTKQYIAGQEYEFATVAEIEAKIAHLDWLLSPSRMLQPLNAAELDTLREMLKYQWLGNAQVRERGNGNSNRFNIQDNYR